VTGVAGATGVVGIPGDPGFPRLPGRTIFGQPAGLATLFFTEMWERLSFYGMRALLVLFLVDQVAHGGMGLDDRTAAAIYGLYSGGTYLACLPGGWIGDRLLGTQRAVLIGGVIITIGHLLLGFAPSQQVFFFGLLVIVIGTGLLKPNCSSMVALLYPEGGARRDAGYTIYYVGINVGATLGPLIAGLLAISYGWPAGFMTAAVGMAAGVLQFLWGRRLLGDAGREPTAAASAVNDDAQPGALASSPAVSSQAAAGRAALRWVVLAGVALAVLVALLWTGVLHASPVPLQGLCTQAVIVVAILYFGYLIFGAGLTRAERLRVVAMVVLFTASVLFWAAYEQTGTSLNLFAERYTDRYLLGWQMPASWFQSLNPIFIVVFGPLFSALWVALARRHLDPSTPLKFVLALLGVGAGFVVMAIAARLVVAGHLVGVGWLSTTYLLHTWAELCLSPVGMSVVTKLVPLRFISQTMGVWLVSLSLGNLLAGRIAGDFDPNHLAAMPGQFLFIVGFTAISAALLVLLLPHMRRWMSGVQ
jgi:POT family proton-dependent oligopeptide transporter